MGDRGDVRPRHAEEIDAPPAFVLFGQRQTMVLLYWGDEEHIGAIGLQVEVV